MPCPSTFSSAPVPAQWLQAAASTCANLGAAATAHAQQAPANADRLESSGACSTSYGSQHTPMWWRPGRHRLPFASLSAQQVQSPGGPAMRSYAQGQRSSEAAEPHRSHPNTIKATAKAATTANATIGAPGKASAPAAAPAAATGAEAEMEARGTAPDVFKAGDVLANGRFRLASKLADGRFTSLWWGQDRDSGQQVVLKLMEAGDLGSYSAGLKEIAALKAAGADGSPPSPPLPSVAHADVMDASASSSTKHSKRAARKHQAALTKAAAAQTLTAAAAAAQPREADGQSMAAALVRGSGSEAAPAVGNQHVVQLLHTFEHRSNAGRHACMAFAPQGDNMASVLTRYGGGAGIGIAPAAVRAVARQLLEALHHMHHVRGVVHMDLKPDNLLLDKPFVSLHEASVVEVVGRRLAEVGAKLRLCKAPGPLQSRPGCYSELDLHTARISVCDFGRAINLRRPLGPSNEDALVIFGRPGARPPEEVLALPYEAPAYDMWSLGCLLFTLSTGADLFSPEPSGDMDINDRHLAAMAGVLGRLPVEMIKASPIHQRYFLPDGRLACELQHVIAREPLPRILADEHGFSQQEAAALSDFITPLLECSPAKRPSAAQQLQHPWLAIEEGKEEDEEEGKGRQQNGAQGAGG